MSEAAVIYQVTLEIDPSVVSEFDEWLHAHMQAMLQLPGFEKAQIIPTQKALTQSGDGWVTRVVQYRLASQADLDAYFHEHAARMRADGIEHFGDRFRASRLVLPASDSLPEAPASSSTLHCLNCGTPLIGKYCSECGQANHTYVAPLWETVEEFFGNHFGLDTKFFHSIVPLLFRPGFLTREYCAGRRERYIKPLRLYLFSSIVFFFCAAWLLTPVHSGVSPAKNPLVVGQAANNKADARKKLQDALSEIESNPGLSKAQKELIESPLRSQLDSLNDNKSKSTVPSSTDKEADSRFLTGDDADSEFGKKLAVKIKKIKEDPQGFWNDVLYHTVPKVMFVFLPLVALLLKLFYIRRKHLYMEHLIFTLHYHSLLFLALLTGVILTALTVHLGWPASVKDWIGTAIKWYLVIYLVLALRNFYQQSWPKTLVKFCLLFVGYFVIAGIGLIGALALAFVEI